MDAFSAQIVRFVREMPDEALLELVKQKLGVLGAAVSQQQSAKAPGAAANLPATGPATRRSSAPASGPRLTPPPTPAERQAMLDAVEQLVKQGSGMSASEVARAASLPQSRAAAALKELKLSRRIFQGGDRRFARYAADVRTADQASETARKNAKGPVVQRKAAVDLGAGAADRSSAAPKVKPPRRPATSRTQAAAA